MTKTLQARKLNISCKFSALAALYIPSKHRGGGWNEASRPGMGGKVIIQVQDDANWNGEGNKPKRMAVVRFILRHGKDVLNSRIKKRLPIKRKDKTTVLFKCASSSTNKIRQKTIFQLIFEEKEDTDDFLMWWYAKNGSTNLEWDESKELGEEDKDADKSRLKRKAVNFSNSGFTPLKKKPKEMQASVLADSTNNTKQRDESPKIRRSDKKHENKEDGREEETLIDYNEAPESQNWMSAFAPYE